MKKILIVLLILAMGLMACKGDEQPGGASGTVDILGAYVKSEGVGEIYIVKKDYSIENITNTTNFAEEHPQISPDGKKIVMEVWEVGVEKNDIFIMNIDGSSRLNLTNTSSVEEFEPAWINNTKIIFVKGGNLYSMDINTKEEVNLTNITDPNLLAGDPSISPDGSKILYSVTEESGNYQTDVWSMNVDGSNQVNITQTTDMNENEAVWASNSKIVYQRYNDTTNSDLFIHDINSGEKTNITNTSNKYEDDPAVSADGKKVLFEVETDLAEDKTEIYIMNIDGTGVQNISNTVGVYDREPCWNPQFVTE